MDDLGEAMSHPVMSEVQARQELEAVGLRREETLGLLPQQHVLVFNRTANPSVSDTKL